MASQQAGSLQWQPCGNQSNWQPSENQYFIKDEPDQFGSQDSGICLKSEPENSCSEEYEPNSISLDSGYFTSFNMSNLEDSVMRTEELKEVKPLVDTTNRWQPPQGLMKLDHPSQQVITINTNVNTNASATTSRSFGFYGHMPVRIQPKPMNTVKLPQTVLPQILSQTVHQNLLPSTSVSSSQAWRKPPRSRKAALIPRLDEYQPENVKPSQELLAARRLLEESLIMGNIVSQARYARINRRLDKVRLHVAQRSSVLRSFSKAETEERSVKRARTEEKAKCSRALYQENKLLDVRKFTWKIGMTGPHKSFNKLSVKRKGKKKRISQLNRQPLMDISDDSDENLRT